MTEFEVRDATLKAFKGPMMKWVRQMGDAETKPSMAFAALSDVFAQFLGGMVAHMDISEDGIEQLAQVTGAHFAETIRECRDEASPTIQ
jgi:hypothetical protein